MCGEGTYRISWENVKKDWPLWLLILSTFLLGLYLAPHLPERLPTHWNIRGEVDAYGSRAFVLYFQPLLTLGLYLLFLFLPLLDPRRANYTRFSGTYQFLKVLLVVFYTGLQLVVLATGLGYLADPTLFVRLGVPLLFVFFGNVMGQIKHNYFVGIKTPWTLASEEVWRRTHRAAGRLWVVCGLIGVLAAFLPSPTGAYLFFAALAAAAIVPIIHSYLLWRAQA